MGQVFRIERTVLHCKSGKTRQETVYGVTSLSPAQAGAGRIGELVRGHWQIENRLHWVRDVTFDEDRSQVRTGTGPRALASLRNFAISRLRLAGCANIARAVRQQARDWRLPLTLLGISRTPPPAPHPPAVCFRAGATRPTPSTPAFPPPKTPSPPRTGLRPLHPEATPLLTVHPGRTTLTWT